MSEKYITVITCDRCDKEQTYEQDGGQITADGWWRIFTSEPYRTICADCFTPGDRAQIRTDDDRLREFLATAEPPTASEEPTNPQAPKLRLTANPR